MAKFENSNFEIYEKTGKKAQVLASVSYPSGRLAITEGAVRHFGLDKAKYVMLMYDRAKNIIGLKFFETKSQPNMTKLMFRKDSGCYIMAANFFKNFGISLPAAANFFELRQDEKLQGVYTFNLNEATERRYGGRKKK